MSDCCSYKFQQGSKKGTVCGATCRGEFCFKHKPKVFEYKKNYYRNQVIGKNENELRKVKDLIEKGDIPDVNKYAMKANKLMNEIKILSKKMLGIKLFLGDITEQQIEDKYDKVFNSSMYQRMNKIFENKQYADLSKEEIEQQKKNYMIEFANFKKPLYTPFKGTKSKANRLLKQLYSEKTELFNRRKILLSIVKLIEDTETKQIDIIEV